MCFCWLLVLHYVEDGASVPEIDTLAADAFPGLNPSFSQTKKLPTVCLQTSHTTPQRTSPNDTILPLPSGGTLTVKRGNLLKEKVTAIVNAANERLDHKGGVALAIDRASWGNVQRESRKVIQKSGRVSTGQVAVTGAGGSLQCQFVIHAVGPDANERPHKECEQLLKLVCENVLRTAEAQEMVSVALPAISSGIYAMKKDVVAQILISTILHYPYQHSSSVKDIRIVLFEEEMLRPFLQFASEAKKGMPPGIAQPVVPVPRAPDVVEIPLEKTHRKMVIKKAHFIYEDADIKVAAICSELGFQTGSNKELDGHLKGQLSEAVRGRYQYRRPGKFDVFTVHVQHATISCRYLVIVNILDRSLGTRHDGHKYLQQIMQAVCQEADTLEMPSVAIALETFTIGGFQPEYVLPEFIHMLSQFKFTNQEFLTDVRFLALDPATFDILLAGAERAIGRSLKQPPRHTQAPQAQQQSCQPGPAGGRSSMSELQTVKEVTSHPDAAADPVSHGTLVTVRSPNQARHEEVHQHASSTWAVTDDVVQIPLEKTHRKMVIKKAHFIYEDADIKVAAICSELGFQTGSNKELDGHLKGQLSEAVRGRYQYRRPGKFDVFTVHVQHATISCRYLVIVNIVDRSLGTRHDGHKYLQQILQAVCQEADTLEMPSVAIAPNTFTVGGFQKGSILPEFIRVISHFRFTNDDFLTDVRFLAANQDGFNGLVADAERTVGKILRRLPQPAKVANQTPLGSSYPCSFPPPHPPTPVVDDVPDYSPASGTDSSKDTQLPSPGPGMTKLSEQVFFALACGDLCKVQADAVVVPVAPSLDLKSGVVQAVDAASGGAISRAVKQIKQTKQKVSEGTAIPVEIAGRLPCKQVILLIRNAKGTSDALDHACREALKLAEGIGAHSVTFPPISSNKGKDKLAKCMMGAFVSFLPHNPQYIVCVTVVVRENDEATLKAFRSLVGEGSIDQGKDKLAQQLKTDTDTFTTPPDSPSLSHQGPPDLEDGSSAKVDQGTSV